MPSLYELSSLFDQAPEMPPMLPRRKGIPGQENPRKGSSLTSVTASARREMSMLDRLLSLIQRLWSPFSQASLNTVKAQRPNPFSSLKVGKKVTVIAAVDSGNISFFKFGQGVFEEWPML
jgi:tRNA-splicing endonuclease subunit Sen54